MACVCLAREMCHEEERPQICSQTAVVESLKMSAVNSLNSMDSHYAREFLSRLPHRRDASTVTIWGWPSRLAHGFSVE